ncbi:TetR family transcriptional regulator [Amorphoplanes digitatis]|uniref:AcrR family transcriptional regulator n=1 Tax=Actinoplanes digitatis TaxID=1868 RepID=A0A7W7I0P1_9ACTN|nr:TetR/AcrR family transcriptional regulator [Actinoplanes digitatis]MBB4764262.1 AcrR family transcriptional regulator [Actinoplanes digitatis]BFE73647.1 TetR/AcrR family transcriptional regulator [Actinoplanes digitatis]GID96346.1 TetR family transcriptional regulator [Actinoplanes digitatis]
MTDPGQPRRRDAGRTRQILLEAARTRFARDGYAATTVRDIADEAGVNVALINRYFTSKEGLFEACLTTAVTDVRRDESGVPVDGIAEGIARRIGGTADDDRLRVALLLLLRSSGDDRIDELRRSVLHAVSEKMASAAGGAEPDDAALLRAQIVLATTLGIVTLRSSLGLQPLASATEEQLLDPLRDLVESVLPGGRPPRS